MFVLGGKVDMRISPGHFRLCTPWRTFALGVLECGHDKSRKLDRWTGAQRVERRFIAIRVC